MAQTAWPGIVNGLEAFSCTISDGNVVESVASSLSGFVYFDANSDGIRVASELRSWA